MSAKTKGEAIELLDEWGNTEQAFLSRMADSMFDFQLSDDGQIELANVSEATRDYITETCYPELDKAMATAEWDDNGVDYTEKGREQI